MLVEKQDFEGQKDMKTMISPEALIFKGCRTLQQYNNLNKQQTNKNALQQKILFHCVVIK